MADTETNAVMTCGHSIKLFQREPGQFALFVVTRDVAFFRPISKMFAQGDADCQR